VPPSPYFGLALCPTPDYVGGYFETARNMKE
jgi:hypothetical protein